MCFQKKGRERWPEYFQKKNHKSGRSVFRKKVTKGGRSIFRKKPQKWPECFQKKTTKSGRSVFRKKVTGESASAGSPVTVRIRCLCFHRYTVQICPVSLLTGQKPNNSAAGYLQNKGHFVVYYQSMPGKDSRVCRDISRRDRKACELRTSSSCR